MWNDPDHRPEILDKLEQKIRRLRELRKRDPDKHAAKAAALWKHAREARPALYRQVLLEALASSSDGHVVSLPEEWTGTIVNDAIQSAREQFHSVYTGGRMQLDEGPGGLPASVRPTFEPKAGSRGPIRNPLRKTPSMVNFDNGPQSELRGTDGASNGADAERSNAALKGSRQRSNVMTAREDRYIFDTGASKHAVENV